MEQFSSSDFVSLAGLLPPDIAVEQGCIDDILGRVWPEEADFVLAAVESRQAEFRAGRILARRAITSLGGREGPILAGPDRAPLWPAGFTGSISHCRGQAAVAVGNTETVRAVGIDIEEVGRFRPELERQILAPEEILGNLDGLPPEPRRAALALLFSIKEAFYKCQYALTRQVLGFHDVRALMNLERGEFEIVPLTPVAALAGCAFHGRYRHQGDAVAAAVALRTDGRQWPE